MTTILNPELIKLNAKSNEVINQMLTEVSNQPVFVRKMVDEVLRPFALALNSAQVNRVEPSIVFDGLMSVMTAMSTEYLMRTVDRRNNAAVMGGIQTILDEYVDSLVQACEVNFGIEIQRHSAAQQAPGGTA